MVLCLSTKHCYFALYILPSHMLVVCVCVYACMCTCMRACMCVCVSCTCVGVGIIYICMHLLWLPFHTVTFTTHMMCSYIYMHQLLSYATACVKVCCCRCLNCHHADQSTGFEFDYFWSQMMKADNKKKTTWRLREGTPMTTSLWLGSQTQNLLSTTDHQATHLFSCTTGYVIHWLHLEICSCQKILTTSHNHLPADGSELLQSLPALINKDSPSS